MDAERNLLFGVLALQMDLIDPSKFAKACAKWAAKKSVPLAAILVELNWITPTDRMDVERLMARRLRKHNDDLKASLVASVDETILRTLAVIDDAEIGHSLLGLHEANPAHVTTKYRPVTAPNERYELTHLHAEGGLGQVWLARDHQLGRDVALKEIRPTLRGNSAVVTRFFNEAQITGQLEHPGIVPVYDLAHRGTDQQLFYTMRFVNGCTLRDAAQEYHRRKSEGEDVSANFASLLRAFADVCNTIAYAHSRGVIHRDLKGENIILGDFGEVIVLDWGLAKLVDQTGIEVDAASVSLQTDAAHTMQGEALGTPAYMAPEQACGRPDLIDHRTDIYGLGAILYELLTGQPPFSGLETQELLRQVREEEPINPCELSTDVPRAMAAMCLRALSKKRSDRYDSASQLADAIQYWAESERKRAEKALRDSEALYRSLVDALPVGLVRKDLKCRFTFGNKHFCEKWGLTPEQVPGMVDADLSPADIAAKYNRDDRRVMETGCPLVTTEEGPEGDDTSFVHTIKTPIYDGRGEIIGIQAIWWDVSDQKQMENSLRRTSYELENCRSRIEKLQSQLDRQH